VLILCSSSDHRLRACSVLANALNKPRGQAHQLQGLPEYIDVSTAIRLLRNTQRAAGDVPERLVSAKAKKKAAMGAA
jgi:hypothetical protein